MKERIKELLSLVDELLSEAEDSEELSREDSGTLISLLDQVYDLLEEAAQVAYNGIRAI